MDWESFYKNYRRSDYIPGYEIISKLGGGVFGAVFKARKQSIGKFYAIKFLKVEDEKVKEAVLRELEGLKFFAQIDHPNLVSIEDKGAVDGIPYIVMGYAGDETLKKRLETGALSTDDTLKIFRQVCEGVQALHEKSIVHFDLKPGNVFIKGGIARVGDYGLSRLMSESRNTLSFGRGTPYYMAPEMLRKKGDKRSDIYSLGVMLYECLTGEVPFKGESEWEVLKQHEVSEVKFPRGVDRAFRSIIRKCLAKKPEERFGSVRELERSLPVTDAEFRRSIAGGDGETPEPAIEVRPRSREGTMTLTLRNPISTMLAPIYGTVGLVFDRLIYGLKQADDSIEAFGNPDGKIRSRKPPTPVPDHYRRIVEGGVIGNTFRLLGMAIEFSILAAFVPLKFVFVTLGRVLDYLVNVPFRLLGVAVKLVVIVAGFYALFLFVRFVLPFSLGILFRF